MASFGSFSLLIALALAAYNLLAGIFSLFLMRTKRPAAVAPQRVAATARRAGIACFVAISAAAFALVWSVFANDFSLLYIAEHSNRALPGPYKFAALWAGQEGSLLLWAWLLAGYGFVLRLTNKTDVLLYDYASTILAGVQVFFLVVLNFTAHPFSMIPGYLPGGPVPDDGNGLNPLLQYPEMVIHPPLLYLGYVGFSVPFAFALGALMMRYPGEKWIRITRKWTMVTWLFLTAGIFLGMHWAYAVLGWGGYWGWDPVEIASLLPWLTGTAFLHSVMMQEKKGLMKSWNIWLIFSTFMLSILGTLLTRGGLVSSVHAFAQSSIGYWFIVFLVITAAVCLFTYIYQFSHVKSAPPDHGLVSRESAFLFGTLVLLSVTVVLLWGTLYPIMSEFTVGNKITYDATWFNRIAVPFGLFLLLLMGVGPLLPWRNTSLRSLRRNFLLPVAVLWIVVIASFALGSNPWKGESFDRAAFYALVGFGLAAGVLTAILSEFFRGARVIMRKTGSNFFAALYQLVRRNTRRYGGYIIHIGVIASILGFAGTAFNKNVEKELAIKDKMQLGGYTLVCTGFTQDSNDNYDTEYAMLDVYRNGQKQFDLAPEHRVYRASQQPQTIVAIHSTILWDLYVVYEGANPDTGQPIIKAYLNPLVSWLWAGVMIIVAGTLIALLPAARPAASAGEESGNNASHKTAEGAVA
jgi:cytochrome c-type biogenesis protein CcmF